MGTPQGVNQHLGVDRLQGVTKSTVFQKFFLVFGQKITLKCPLSTKKLEHSKKVFQSAFGWVQQPETGQNTQQILPHVLQFGLLNLAQGQA